MKYQTSLNEQTSYKNKLENIKKERSLLKDKLIALNCVEQIFPSEANFLLVQFTDAERIFEQLKNEGIIIRNRTKQVENCLRITVGTNEQNQLLLNTLKTF